MIKPDVIEMMSQLAEGGGTKCDAEKYINAFLATLEYAAEHREKVKLAGYLTMDIYETKERKGRNPQTRETIILPPNETVKIKTGKILKDKVRK